MMNFQKRFKELYISNYKKDDAIELSLDIACLLFGLADPTLGAAMNAVKAPIKKGIINMLNFSQRQFTEKLEQFFIQSFELGVDKRREIIEGLDKFGNNKSANILCDVIDKFDDNNKVEILCNLLRNTSLGNSALTFEEFIRASYALKKIPYVDIKYLREFDNDQYIPGVTESLYSAGVIYQSIITFNKMPSFHLNLIGYHILNYGTLEQISIPKSFPVKFIDFIRAHFEQGDEGLIFCVDYSK